MRLFILIPLDCFQYASNRRHASYMFRVREQIAFVSKEGFGML